MDDEWRHRFNRSWEEDRLCFDAMRKETQESFRTLYELIREWGEKLDANTASTNAMLKNHERRLLILEGRATTKA